MSDMVDVVVQIVDALFKIRRKGCSRANLGRRRFQGYSLF